MGGRYRGRGLARWSAGVPHVIPGILCPPCCQSSSSVSTSACCKDTVLSPSGWSVFVRFVSLGLGVDCSGVGVIDSVSYTPGGNWSVSGHVPTCIHPLLGTPMTFVVFCNVSGGSFILGTVGFTSSTSIIPRPLDLLSCDHFHAIRDGTGTSDENSIEVTE